MSYVIQELLPLLTVILSCRFVIKLKIIAVRDLAGTVQIFNIHCFTFFLLDKHSVEDGNGLYIGFRPGLCIG